MYRTLEYQASRTEVLVAVEVVGMLQDRRVTGAEIKRVPPPRINLRRIKA